jgi:fructokinase
MRLGIDLGGTKIAGVVLADDGKTVWEARVATPRGNYDETLEAIAGLVDEGERASGARCTVGIGMPGTISPATGVVKNANSTWLNGRALQVDLARRLGRDVRLSNDANCLAVSEAADGAGAGARVVFGVILGTGVGGGVAVDGRAVIGPNAVAGEWGHNPLPWPTDSERPGGACYCGLHGCIETFLSGPAVAAAYRDRTGREQSATSIAGLAQQGDLEAVAVIDQWVGRRARARATAINLLDPDVIVVGGGLSRIAQLYERVPRKWGAWVFSDQVATPVVPARFGDASGVRGAARLW